MRIREHIREFFSEEYIAPKPFAFVACAACLAGLMLTDVIAKSAQWLCFSYHPMTIWKSSGRKKQ